MNEMYLQKTLTKTLYKKTLLSKKKALNKKHTYTQK